MDWSSLYALVKLAFYILLLVIIFGKHKAPQHKKLEAVANIFAYVVLGLSILHIFYVFRSANLLLVWPDPDFSGLMLVQLVQLLSFVIAFIPFIISLLVILKKRPYTLSTIQALIFLEFALFFFVVIGIFLYTLWMINSAKKMNAVKKLSSQPKKKSKTTKTKKVKSKGIK